MILRIVSLKIRQLKAPTKIPADIHPIIKNRCMLSFSHFSTNISAYIGKIIPIKMPNKIEYI
jgi:hypothetical protein